RSPMTDVRECLFEAGRNFAGADIDEVLKHHTIFLTAGPGVFATEAVVLSAARGPRLHVRARTWLTNDMLLPRQQILASAATPDRAVIQTMRQLADAGGIEWVLAKR